MCLYRVPQKAPGILFSNGLKQENRQNKKACVCSRVCVRARVRACVLQKEAEMIEKEKKRNRQNHLRYYETADRRREWWGRMRREKPGKRRGCISNMYPDTKKIEMLPLCK